MSEYERLSDDLARWLSMASGIEALLDEIDTAAMRTELADEEYELLCALSDAVRPAWTGWQKTDEAHKIISQAKR